MKVKIVALGCLIGIAALFMGAKSPQAELKAGESDLKIGVVSVRKVFRDCKRNAKYREEAAAEQDKLIKELEKLKTEIDAEEAGLKTLKEGSSDYMAQLKDLLTKQAEFQTQQRFHKQWLELKHQQWTEKLYKDILQVTKDVAAKKDLDLVFEKDELELPVSSADELMLAIRTHKLLYSGDRLDITEEVMAWLDAEKSKE